MRRVLAVAPLLLAVPSLGAPATQSPSPGPKLTAEQIRARERSVILDVRTLVMAAKDYAAANRSFVDELRCLGRPEECVPDYPKDAPAFVDPSYDFLRTWLGYERKFHPGSRPSEAEIQAARASATSLRSFAYTAVPEKVGETGGRAFCGDSTGRICFTANGAAPEVVEGRCAKSCQELK